MAKGTGQKRKLLELAKIFYEETDVDTASGKIHGLNTTQIIEKLQNRGISAERKSLYDDFETLKQYGIEISSQRIGRSTYYYVCELPYGFELSEIKILVDSIQVAKFISERQSDQIIAKLEKLLSKFQQSEINHNVSLNGRIKTMNSSSIYVIDAINRAINSNKSISFDYYHYTVKEKELQRKNKQYFVDPMALVWSEENYYLIGFSLKDSEIRHYRVDKMKSIEVLKKNRIFQNHVPDFNANEYVNTVFSMFGGKDEQKVTLKIQNSLIGVFKDRFGDIEIEEQSDEHFTASIVVRPSKQFFGWLFALDGQAEILAPTEIKDEYISMLKEQLKIC